MLQRISVRLVAGVLFAVLTAFPAAAAQRGDFGTLAIQVRPPDAVILIDREPWVGPHTTGPLQIQLSPGSHRVELRSPGHRPYSADIEIRAGETTALNVALPAGPTAPRAIRPAGPVGFAESDDEDGFVIAPDFRVSEIDHQAGTLAGAYGGYVFAGRVLIGGGGYWQTNTTNGGRIAYGGPVIEWRLFASRVIGFNLHGLVGGGQWHVDEFLPYPQPLDRHGMMGDPRFNTIHYGHFNEDFFVAEPEAQMVIRFGDHVRLQAGAGYRATSTSGLSGASGSVSVQIGK